MRGSFALLCAKKQPESPDSMDNTEVAMAWWGWVILALVIVVVLMTLVAVLQRRRRRGGVIGLSDPGRSNSQ